MKPIVQISLDLTNIDEALETAAMAMRAGVDWLEAGTPLILAEGFAWRKKIARSISRHSDCCRSQNNGWGLSGSRDDGKSRRYPRCGNGPCSCRNY